MKIKVFAPATIANFIIGFDTLGAALSDIKRELLGDIVTIEEHEKFNIEIEGNYAFQLPVNSHHNVVSWCEKIFHQHLESRGKSRRNFILRLEKRLPIGSGLGSSATSIVATLFALNIFYEEIFTKKELLLLAGQMEGAISHAIHYDNVSPCLLGGLQLMIPDKIRITETLPFFEDWFFIIYYPGITISTSYARKILPKSFELKQVTVYWQTLASFIHGLYQNDKTIIKSLLKDTMIEPCRSGLVPGFEEAKLSALTAGAVAFGLSGSGPTCFAISESLETAKHIQSAIQHAMPDNPASFSKICTLDKQGARLL